MAEYKLSYTANEIDEKLKRIKEGSVGYAEPSEVLTWDGDFDDTEVIMGALYAGKITDKYMDLNSVESLVVKYENGSTKTLTASEWIIHTDMDTGIQVLISAEDEVPYVFSSSADVEGMMNKGLYFSLSTDYYAEKITFAGTIHPIDPKFLPDGFIKPIIIVDTNDDVYTANTSFEEAAEAITSGKYFDIKYVANSPTWPVLAVESVAYYGFSTIVYDRPVIEIETQGKTLYWTQDGISTTAPPSGK